MAFELVICLVQLIEVPPIGNLPSLVRGRIIVALAGSCTAGVARMTARALESLSMKRDTGYQIHRTLVLRSLQAAQAVVILRGLCSTGVDAGPATPSDGRGARGCCAIGSDINNAVVINVAASWEMIPAAQGA